MEQIPGILKVVEFVISIESFLRSTYNRLEVLAFRAQSRLSPSMIADQARAIAFGTLGGNVVAAIPYRDFGNPRQLIAAVREPYEGGHEQTLYILEQFGRSWRVVWHTDPIHPYDLPLPQAFAVHDADGDGKMEISLGFGKLGSAYEGYAVYLYVPSQPQTYCVKVDRDWTNPAEVVPRIKVEPPEAGDTPYIRALETLCDKLDLTKPVPFIDLDHPVNAVLRWHKENGARKDGPVSIHLYEGPGPFDPIPEGCLEDGDYLWIAYFKGPVYGYIKSQNKHFIPYSPASIYLWVNCLVASNRYLWMGTHGDGIVRFDKKKHVLKQFIFEFEGQKADTIISLERRGVYFLLNGEFEVHADVLEQPAAY